MSIANKCCSDHWERQKGQLSWAFRKTLVEGGLPSQWAVGSSGPGPGRCWAWIPHPWNCSIKSVVEQTFCELKPHAEHPEEMRCSGLGVWMYKEMDLFRPRHQGELHSRVMPRGPAPLSVQGSMRSSVWGARNVRSREAENAAPVGLESLSFRQVHLYDDEWPSEMNLLWENLSLASFHKCSNILFCRNLL